MAKRLKQNPLRIFLFHILYWMGVIVVFAGIWGSYDHDYLRSLMIQVWSLPARLMLAYTAIFFLIPRFFSKDRYLLFGLSYFAMAIVSGMLIQRSIIVFVVEGNYLPYHSSQFFNLTHITNTIFDVNNAAILLVIIHMVKSWKAGSRGKTNTDNAPSDPPADAGKNDWFMIKHESRQLRLKFSDVLFVESQRNYVKIQTIYREYTTYASISSMEKVFEAENFIRCHRSFVANLDHMSSFTAQVLKIDDFEVPIGRKYKPLVSEKLSHTPKLHMKDSVIPLL